MKSIAYIAVILLTVALIIGVQNVEAQTEPIKIGDVQYNLIGMSFKPALNGTVIKTSADHLTFQLNQTGGLSMAAFLNTVTVTVTTPDNVTSQVRDIKNFTVNLSNEGNYTVTFSYGSWIPLLGRVVEMVTGKGTYTLTIVKENPFSQILPAILVVAGIVVVVGVVIAVRRKRGKVWLK